MADQPAAEPPHPPDTATRLAFENIFLAQERTQLAWVQAGLAFISFGFTIAKAFQFLHEQRGENAPLLGARSVGIMMVAIGLVSLVLASAQHRRAMAAIRRQCPGLPISHAGVLAVLLAGLGIVALFGAVLRG
jgi:inner membrane protein YidH